jgi:hypothetical protein
MTTWSAPPPSSDRRCDVPNTAPPAQYDGTISRHVVRRGSCLWRVHHGKHEAQAFNPNPADPLFGGARFDATEADRYPFCYAALDEVTALCETLLRSVAADERGMRLLSRPAIAGRQISGLTLTRDLELVSLISGQDLAAIGQDHWLVTAAGPEYAQTRGWARWLRGQAPWAHGFIWSSLRDAGGQALVLFGDRCAAAFGADYERTLLHNVAELAVSLDGDAGIAWLNTRLVTYRVAVAYPDGTA